MNTKRIAISALSFFMAASFSNRSLAKAKDPCVGNKSFAAEFLRLENSGGRLKANAKIFSLTTDAEDAVWNTAWVVSDYQIESCETVGNDTTLKARYTVVGSISSNDQGFPVFSESSKGETVSYHLVKRQNRWNVADISDVRPHVSVPAAIDAINDIVQHNSFDPAYGKNAQNAIGQLKSAARPERMPASVDESPGQ